MNVGDPLIDLFGRVLSVDVTRLKDSSSPETEEKWDSVRGMQLVAEIEEKFSVEFSTDEIMAMDSIGAARKLLKEKGVLGI
jgi:acyl carrier protein